MDKDDANNVNIELDRKAISIAKNALKKDFDWQAYILLRIAEKSLFGCNLRKETRENQYDVLPDISVDENMSEMLSCFIIYFKEKNIESLECCMVQCKKIISEIYHTCGNDSERNIVKSYIDKIAKIVI